MLVPNDAICLFLVITSRKIIENKNYTDEAHNKINIFFAKKVQISNSDLCH
jgi:hypothetical protein